MSNEQNLPFPMSEYQARMAKLHQKMDEAGVDAMVVAGAANLFYLAGEPYNWDPMQYFIVPQNGDPRMVVMITEEYNVENFNWVKDWVSYKPDAGVDALKIVQEQIADMGLANAKIGLEKDCYTALDYEHLAGLLSDATLVDMTQTTAQMRMLKSPAEAEYMRKAARAVEASLRAGIAALKPGVTENDVAAEVYRAAILAGSQHMANTSFMCAGDRTHIPHATWSGKRLEQGDIFFFEISCKVGGYTVPLHRPVFLGQPSKERAHAAEACIVALNRTIEAMQPGVPANEVQRVCDQAFVEEGFGPDTFRHAAAYHIGLQWGDPIPWTVGTGFTHPLEPGMTFHLVPHLEFYEEKYTVTCGEVVMITENGNEVLTNFERKLFVV